GFEESLSSPGASNDGGTDPRRGRRAPRADRGVAEKVFRFGGRRTGGKLVHDRLRVAARLPRPAVREGNVAFPHPLSYRGPPCANRPPLGSLPPRHPGDAPADARARAGTR